MEYCCYPNRAVENLFSALDTNLYLQILTFGEVGIVFFRLEG